MWLWAVPTVQPTPEVAAGGHLVSRFTWICAVSWCGNVILFGKVLVERGKIKIVSVVLKSIVIQLGLGKFALQSNKVFIDLSFQYM